VLQRLWRFFRRGFTGNFRFPNQTDAGFPERICDEREAVSGCSGRPGGWKSSQSARVAVKCALNLRFDFDSAGRDEVTIRAIEPALTRRVLSPGVDAVAERQTNTLRVEKCSRIDLLSAAAAELIASTACHESADLRNKTEQL
jgi:hypothetical protein